VSRLGAGFSWLLLRRLVWPKVDLVIRWWLAQIFLVSGVLKLTHWQTAPAWWLWGIVHVGFLVGIRNRVATMLNWFWTYLSFGGGIRLITGGDK